MKLTTVAKALLHKIPGYHKRVVTRKIQQFRSAESQLRASANRKRVFNLHLQQPQHVYSQGVQEVLNFYEQEVNRLQSVVSHPRPSAREFNPLPAPQHH